jgi:hypothetical protein
MTCKFIASNTLPNLIPVYVWIWICIYLYVYVYVYVYVRMSRLLPHICRCA